MNRNLYNIVVLCCEISMAEFEASTNNNFELVTLDQVVFVTGRLSFGWLVVEVRLRARAASEGYKPMRSPYRSSFL